MSQSRHKLPDLRSLFVTRLNGRLSACVTGYSEISPANILISFLVLRLPPFKAIRTPPTRRTGFRTAQFVFLATLLLSPGMATAGSAYTPLVGFQIPPAVPGPVLSDSSGNFWGVTTAGGAYGWGSVFSYNPSSGISTTIASFSFSFSGNSRGAAPLGLISDNAGNFWGVTSWGGAYSYGTLFKVNAATGVTQTVVDFASSGTQSNLGFVPLSLIYDGAGNLWGTTEYGGANGDGTIFKVSASTGVISIVANLSITSFPVFSASDQAGNLWGSYHPNGNSFSENNASLFKFSETSGSMSLVASLPESRANTPFVADGSGNLWFTTPNGGFNLAGSVEELNTSTGTVTDVADFDGGSVSNSRGAQPYNGLTLDGAGNLWGTTTGGGANGQGTVFTVSTSSSTLTTISDFSAGPSGATPSGSLAMDTSGNFWGASGMGGTYGKGFLFTVDHTSGTINPVYSFGNNSGLAGSYPVGPLTIDNSGNLWGSAEYGGNNSTHANNGPTQGYGSIFEITTSGNQAGLILLDGTTLGANPVGSLFAGSQNDLWATTSTSGSNGGGELLHIQGSTATPTFSFQPPSNGNGGGATPLAGLVSDTSGILWGTTSAGGTNGGGTIYKYNPSQPTNPPVTVVNFQPSVTGSARGANPLSSLTLDEAGDFWGTTSAGGQYGHGTLFVLNPNTGSLNTVADFASTTSGSNRGGYPVAPVVFDSNGNLWGTTKFGGDDESPIGVDGAGTVFEYTPSTGALVTVFDFSPYTGSYPLSSLVSDGAGNLWGTTSTSFLNNYGTVYKINTATGAFSKMLDFTGVGGTVPGAASQASLLFSNGAFYGTTSQGGITSSAEPAGGGGVFKIDPSGTGFAPTISNLTATIISGGIQFTCLVNPNGADTVVSFLDIASSQDIGSGTNPVLVSGTLGANRISFQNLLQATASNSGGTSTLPPSDYITSIPYGPAYTIGAPVVTSAAVTLTGSITPNGFSGIQAWWQYGLSPASYSSSAAIVVSGTGVIPIPVATAIPKSKLPANIYHFRLVVKDGVGSIDSPDETLSTEAPVIGPGTPGSSINGITVSATINPNSNDTQVYFQYGLTTAYVSMTPAQDIGSGSSGVLVSGAFSGLAPNTLYNFRSVIVNALGTFFGPNQTITTAALFGTTSLISTKQIPPGITSGTFKVLGIPVMNDLDHVAFQSTLTGPGLSAAAGNNSGIWADIGTTGLQLIAQTGSAAPDYTGTAFAGTFGKLSDPVYTDNDAVAFLGTLEIAGTVTAANNIGIWFTPGTAQGTMILVARAGDPAPDATGTTTSTSPIFSTISQFVLPQQGGVVLLAKLQTGIGGATGANNIGVWGVDTDGLLKKIIRTGDSLTVNGMAETITGLAIFNAPAASSGQTRHFNNAGDLTYKATFKDGSSAIVQSVFP